MFDSAGTTAIGGATVSYLGADGTTNSTITAADGTYSFGVLPAESYTVTATDDPSYVSQGFGVDLTAGGPVTQDFNLAANTPQPTPTPSPSPT